MCFIVMSISAWAAQLECWSLQNWEAKVTFDVAIASRGSSKSLLECQGSFVLPLIFLYGSHDNFCVLGPVVIDEATTRQFLHNEIAPVVPQKLSLTSDLYLKNTTKALISFPLLLREDILPSFKKGCPCFSGRPFIPVSLSSSLWPFLTLRQFWKGR